MPGYRDRRSGHQPASIGPRIAANKRSCAATRAVPRTQGPRRSQITLFRVHGVQERTEASTPMPPA
ncbi:Hypothetical protein A7982_07165 [Minicystis rosea]|nr:Hypothetical protein A7982_07165 [Minicystis rosea]